MQITLYQPLIWTVEARKGRGGGGRSIVVPNCSAIHTAYWEKKKKVESWVKKRKTSFSTVGGVGTEDHSRFLLTLSQPTSNYGQTPSCQILLKSASPKWLSTLPLSFQRNLGAQWENKSMLVCPSVDNKPVRKKKKTASVTLSHYCASGECLWWHC